MDPDYVDWKVYKEMMEREENGPEQMPDLPKPPKKECVNCYQYDSCVRPDRGTKENVEGCWIPLPKRSGMEYLLYVVVFLAIVIGAGKLGYAVTIAILTAVYG